MRECRPSLWDECLMEGRNEPTGERPGTFLPGWWCDWCHTANPLPLVVCQCGRRLAIFSK
jgi:hypothetical protein